MLVTVNVAAPTQYQQDMAMRWFQREVGAGVMEFHEDPIEPFFVFQWRGQFPSMDDLLDDLRRLCDTADQDCIAVMLDHSGFLIGPETDKYGEFEFDKFTQPGYAA